MEFHGIVAHQPTTTVDTRASSTLPPSGKASYVEFCPGCLGYYTSVEKSRAVIPKLLLFLWSGKLFNYYVNYSLNPTSISVIYIKLRVLIHV